MWRKRHLQSSIYENAVIVITGGSAGIGLSLALAIVGRHKPKRIILLARNMEVLKCAQQRVMDARSSKSTNIDIFVCDVSNEDAVSSVTNQIADAVDILVNCAGISYPTEIDKLSTDQIYTMVNTNLIGSILLTRQVVPRMKEKKKGVIVFVSSQAGQAGLYGYTVYSATKFGLRGLAESLQMELRPHGIKVCIAFPPDTNTEAYVKENAIKPEATRLMSESGVMEPDDVANILCQNIGRCNFSIWFNFDGFMLTQLTSGFCPPNHLWHLVYQILLVGPFRLIAFVYLKYFDSIARRCVLGEC
jgi:3-dehydrosphinganine reductase